MFKFYLEGESRRFTSELFLAIFDSFFRVDASGGM
jgi:hypothetical protein